MLMAVSKQSILQTGRTFCLYRQYNTLVLKYNVDIYMLFKLTDTSWCNRTSDVKDEKLDMQFLDTSKVFKFAKASTP